MPKMSLLKLYAGCDVDERVKLFFTDDGVKSEPVTLKQWIEILDSLGATPGEMLVVQLIRE